MKTKIYYFSGTGNSLNVANELCKKISYCSISPIIELMKKKEIKAEDEAIGFVFPLYAYTLPHIVKEFIEKIDITTVKYIFAVVTRGGSPCRVFYDLNKILKKKKKTTDANFYITMANNFILYFDPPTEAELNKLRIEEKKEIEKIVKIVNNKEKSLDYEKGSFLLERIISPFIKMVSHTTGYFGLANSFYTDSNCNGCGLCKKICLADRIEIEDGKPKWDKKTKCLYCFACLQYCPNKSIQFKMSKTKKRNRYHHPEITAAQIAKQKE